MEVVAQAADKSRHVGLPYGADAGGLELSVHKDVDWMGAGRDTGRLNGLERPVVIRMDKTPRRNGHQDQCRDHEDSTMRHHDCDAVGTKRIV